MPLTAVILAAGQGTRMRSKTPKVLHDLCGWPLVRWPVEAARKAGAQTVVVVDGPEKPVEGHVPEGVKIAVQDEPNGTGHAVQSAAEHIGDDDTVLVLYGDGPLITAAILTEIAQVRDEGNVAAVAATTILDDPSGYGRILRDTDGNFVRVVETKETQHVSPEDLRIKEVNSGVYAFHGGPLKEALRQLRPDDAVGEYFLPDVLPLLMNQGHEVVAHRVDDPTLTLGINDRVQLAEVRAIAQRRIIEALQTAGVTFTNPATATVDVEVAVGPDTTIEPGTTLRGQTTIGEGCTIGPNSTIIDTKLGDAVTALHAYSIGADVEDGVSIGPFAYLRPGTKVRRNAKIGTFVEIKNSDIGEGTKVPHLSYLGDADVGPNTNIGASNVTANYDGKKKHRTTIGANVKTSVDTTFVAPVKIGDNAYTAAGSVITDDVPDGALGVARARQENVEGYARRKD